MRPSRRAGPRHPAVLNTITEILHVVDGDGSLWLNPRARRERDRSAPGRTVMFPPGVSFQYRAGPYRDALPGRIGAAVAAALLVGSRHWDERGRGGDTPLSGTDAPWLVRDIPEQRSTSRQTAPRYVSLTIPTGVAFQFRRDADAPLRFVALAMPAWPLDRDDEAETDVPGHWAT